MQWCACPRFCRPSGHIAGALRRATTREGLAGVRVPLPGVPVADNADFDVEVGAASRGVALVMSEARLVLSARGLSGPCSP